MKISNVNLTPTMRCNLRCRLCGVMVPQYDYRPEMTVEEFRTTLKAFYEVVDEVERLQITGGEPLLHPKLNEILEVCFEYQDYFHEMLFFSNCAVPLREDVVNVLERYKDKVIVHCSDYGMRPEVSEQNLQILQRTGISYRYLKYFGESQYCEGWVDNGDFVAHHRTKKENETVFAACSHVRRGGSWYIRHGQMHWCGRSVRGTELHKIPLCEGDYLDLFDQSTTASEKREALEKLLQVSTITACDYCNGNYGTEDVSKRYPAGEQMSC